MKTLFWNLYLITAILILIISDARGQQRSKTGEQVTSTLNSLLKNYDKRVRPNYGGQPVDVGITMYILSVDSVSENDMEFTITMYFRQVWRDPRLQYTGLFQEIPTIGNELRDKIWTPDTFIVNQKSANVTGEFLRIDSQGEVLSSVRMRTTASCLMHLRFYPLDRQLCSLEMESFSRTMNDIKFYWAKGSESIGISAEVSSPPFYVIGHRGQVYEISLSTGNYSRLAVHIQFGRSFGYTVMSTYIPAATLVLLSWVPLWFNGGDALISRILTGVISAMSVLQIWHSTSVSSPKISYVKAIDIYLVGCIGFIFLTIIEHTMIICLIKRRKSYKRSLQSERPRRKPCCLRLAPRLLDWFTRLALPVMFIAFNITYWKFYLTFSVVLLPDLISFKSN